MKEEQQHPLSHSRRAPEGRGVSFSGSFSSGVWHALLILVALAATTLAHSQAPAAGPPIAPTTAAVPTPEVPKAAAPDKCGQPLQGNVPVVLEAYRPEPVRRALEAEDLGPVEYSHEQDAKLGDTIALKVQHLDSLRQWQECIAKLGVTKKLVLYLDDRALPDVAAEPPLDPASGIVMFPLKRTEASRAVWTRLLGGPRSATRTVKVSLGPEDQFAIQSEANLHLRVLPKGPLIFWCLVFLCLLVMFGSLARRSDLLRSGDAPLVPGKQKPWSLARVQAAWWFFLVLASYLLIGLVTGDFSSSITGTTLILLGIAAGTTLGSVAVDMSRKTPENEHEEQAARRRLTLEIAALDAEMLAFDPETADAEATAAEQERVATRKAKYSQLCKLMRANEGFLKDILSDANGVSFHRFQIAAWTLVLGIVFVLQVFRELSMPQFSETLLGLMGLSSATFVAMKTTEPTAPKPPAKP
jgi:hypothetical protein